MTKDFKNMRRWTEADEIALSDLMRQIMAVFLVFIASVSVTIILSANAVEANSITGATTDLLMGSDMAEYLAMHPNFIAEEGDIE